MKLIEDLFSDVKKPKNPYIGDILSNINDEEAAGIIVDYKNKVCTVTSKFNIDNKRAYYKCVVIDMEVLKKLDIKVLRGTPNDLQSKFYFYNCSKDSTHIDLGPRYQTYVYIYDDADFDNLVEIKNKNIDCLVLYCNYAKNCTIKCDDIYLGHSRVIHSLGDELLKNCKVDCERIHVEVYSNFYKYIYNMISKAQNAELDIEKDVIKKFKLGDVSKRIEEISFVYRKSYGSYTNDYITFSKHKKLSDARDSKDLANKWGYVYYPIANIN